MTVDRSVPEQSDSSQPSGGPGRGRVLGRYVLLDELGAGNMGVVYAAYDPELDRKVALKVVLPARSGQGATRARMLREAHALARLSHPNVVTIHDVGAHDDQVWIAMEFVAGQTLGAWARQPRPWTESLRVLIDAGRGVAAAHAAGLVHRDLKPDNVMIDGDGRVRVMDFGLAHGRAGAAAEDTEASSGGAPTPSPGSSSLAEQLTRAGAAPGTPAYMAPEQWRGGEAGAAVDQFGWSVMAWELLYGERPFQATTVAGLAVAVTSGRRQPPPRGRRVPGWLRRVLERGLAIEPSERWPSMTALLAEVERGRTRARMNLIAAAAVGVVALVALVVGLRDWEVARQEAACAAESAAEGAVWHDDARRALREAFAATGLADAAATADRVIPWLEERAAAWQRSRTQACLDFEVHGTRDPSLNDAAYWCLEDRQMEFSALTAEFARATPATVQKAVTAATNLGDPEVCLDELVLRRLPVPPSDAREALGAARRELMQAFSLNLTGDYGGGREAAARAGAAGGAWLPLRAAARAQEGVSLTRMGKFAEAEAASAEAYFSAASVEAWAVAASAATNLIVVLGQQERHADSRTWGRHAEVTIALAGDPTHLLEAKRLTYLGLTELAAGAADEARALLERGLSRWEAALGPEHPDVAKTLGNVAIAYAELGRSAEAIALETRALAIYEKTLGPRHPDVATVLGNLGAEYNVVGMYASAVQSLERTLEILEVSLNPDHPHVATALCNLGNALAMTGRRARARALFERGLRIYEATFGPDHPRVSEALEGLAIVQAADGELAASLASARRALAVGEGALGPDHPTLASTLTVLAEAELATGALAGARASAERAVAVLERSQARKLRALGEALELLARIEAAGGDLVAAEAHARRALAVAEECPDRSVTMMVLRTLAVLALRAGRVDEARALAERAVDLAEAVEGRQVEAAAARFSLAQALVADDGARARSLARRARDDLREAGAGPQLAEVERWLAAQGE